MTDGIEFQLGQWLLERGWKLAVAESCTGGLIGHRITNVPGSSEYYLGSVTAYAYEAKEKLLGVSHDHLLQYGAVSEEIVLEMAQGVRQALSADLGVSVSGIAGPGGGMPNKPVGLVWIGMSTPDGDWARRFLFDGDRVENKEDAAEAALQMLAEYLTGQKAAYPVAQPTVRVQARTTPQGVLLPQSFDWQGRSWSVVNTGRRWQDGGGEHILCQTANGAVFELIYDSQRQQWQMGFHNDRSALA